MNLFRYGYLLDKGRKTIRRIVLLDGRRYPWRGGISTIRRYTVR